MKKITFFLLATIFFVSCAGNIYQTQEYLQLTGKTVFFGKLMDFDSGQYGMATLSSLNFISSEVLKLPDCAEPRSANIQVVELIKDLAYSLVNVHFDWTSPKYRIPQIEKLLKRLNALDLPTIILSDYNLTFESKSLKVFDKYNYTAVKKGINSLTWNAESPTMKIDHVYYKSTSSFLIEPQSIEVLNEPNASDQRPVVAQLKLTLLN